MSEPSIYDSYTVVGPNGEPSSRVETHRHEYADKSVKMHKLIKSHIKHKILHPTKGRVSKFKTNKFY